MKEKIKNALYRKQTLYKIVKYLYILIKCLFYSLISLLYYMFRVYPINNRKIVFCSYFGNGYGDNPKYIAEEIINQKLNIDMVWLLRKELFLSHNLPPSIRPVKKNSLRGIYEMVTAKVWIDNSRKPYFVKKRKGQYYIQTWHGAPALKKIEKDVEDKLDKIYVKNAKEDSDKVDLFLSNCKHFSNLIKKSFWYNGEILECGLPRNDIIFKRNKIINEKVRKYFNISKDKKIVLYAPTFRKNSNIDVYNLDINMCLNSLTNRFKGEWVFLVRLHPNVQYKTFDILNKKNVFNASLYDDLQEILSVVDVLITDYSSLMFDFALTGLPVFLYAPDIEDYKNDRNFYFCFEELPFSLAENNYDLSNAINNFNEVKYKEDLKSFFNYIGSFENGNASKIVVDKIKEIVFY